MGAAEDRSDVGACLQAVFSRWRRITFRTPCQQAPTSILPAGGWQLRQIIPRGRVARVGAQRGPIFLLRAAPVTFSLQHRAEIVVRFRKSGLQPDGVTEIFLRFGEPIR